jgi:hydroxyacylglutathione hydrolase
VILETVVVGVYMVNCYILAVQKDSEALIIDPGDQKHLIEKALNKHNLKPVCVINTHGHIDHIRCDDDFNVPVYAHTQELSMLQSAALNLSNFVGNSYTVASQLVPLTDRQRISCAGIDLEIIHTPGHTPGGMCVYWAQEAMLFSGDTLFYHSVGRSDFPGADEQRLIHSIRDKLFILPEKTIVLPGHGPRSSIGQEKKENPFVR